MTDQSAQRYPIHPPAYGPMIAILRFLVRALTKLHIEGMENLPENGAYLIVSNHLHYFDTPVLGTSFVRKAWVLAAEKYENHWFFGPILRTGGAIFIDRGEVDRVALRTAMNVLEDGHPLAVAVEGTRSKTGALAEGKTGAAYLATRMNVPIVPAVVWGTEAVIPAWKKLRRADVFVRYGEPFWLPEGRARSAQLDQYTEWIMVTLAAMLPEPYRGLYRDHPLLKQMPVRPPFPD